mgnify:FL=1
MAVIKKGKASFTIIGEAKVNDYTYRIDAKSERSDWIYNSLNLGIDCGEKHGTVYVDMMGGYGAERDNVLYVHGKDDEGRDDFQNRFTIDWDDRFNETFLEDVGDLNFIRVGLEKDKNDKVFYKDFLSEYDAILYIQEHLQDGMVVNVKGDLEYSLYNDRVNMNKRIKSIVLSKVDDVSKYKATFTQTMLLTKDSVNLRNADKAKGIIPIYAKVPEYQKEYKGKVIRKTIPLDFTFEYEVDLTNKELVTKIIDKVFKVRRDVTEITFEGDFIEGGALVTVTEDDIPDDIKELIEMGVYTQEEALAKCTENTSRERRMVLRKPLILMQGGEGNKIPAIQKFERKYTEEDLVLDFMIGDEEEVDTDEDGFIDVDDETLDGMDWLDNL